MYFTTACASVKESFDEANPKPVTRWDLNQTRCLTSELERVEEDWLAKPSQNTTQQSTTGTSDVMTTTMP